jgi:hypothetical protein
MMSLMVLLAVQALSEHMGALVRQTAQARVPLARGIAYDPTVVKAVHANNASPEDLAAVKKKDKAWPTDAKMRQEVIDRPCSVRMRELIAGDPLVVEAFVMDHLGGLACTTVATTDYWQGDEAKWQKTFVDGLAAFVDEPALDASTGVFAIQLSVPMAEGDRRVGAVTLTLKLRLGQGGIEPPKVPSR